MSDWVQTTCMRCAVGCGHVQRGVDTGYGIDSVRGDAKHPVSEGLACQRGTEESANPGGEWLTRPLVREEGELRKTSWEEALSVVGEQFRDALADSPHAVGVLGSGQQTNEAAYALGKVARGGFGTRNYDANTTLCMASAVTAYYDAFGSDAPPPTYDDIPEAETHVVWGANPAVAHPVMFRWIRESAADGDLLAVDPVETDTAETADAHVAPDPGEDLTLARAVLARLVDRDAVDESFVREATVGFDALRARLPDPADAAASAGVSVSDVDRLADAFEQDCLVYWGMGVNQHVNGTATAGALVDLCLATGNLGPGSGPFSLTGQANSMGTRVFSAKGSWPGHRAFGDPAARAEVAETWGVPVDRLPDDTGPGPVGLLDGVGDEVEALWCVATNPVAGVPDAENVAEQLEEAFLVVQDAFRSETVEYADVVLPAATWGEASGTAVNMERTVSRVRPATETPEGVRHDLDIVASVADAVVPEFDLFDGPPCDPAAVFREACDLTAGTLADCSGLSYTRLDAELAVRWPAPTPTAEGGYRYHDPPAAADADGATGDADTDRATESNPADCWSFPTDSGKARFTSVTGTAEEPLVSARHAEPTDEQYPLTLTTGRERDAYNTGVRTRDEQSDRPVARVAPGTLAAFSADTASEPAVADGGAVPASGDGDATPPPTALRVVSRRGDVTVEATPDEAVPTGVVWLPIHHTATNELTLPAADPRSEEPNLKQCAVRLAPLGDDDTDGTLFGDDDTDAAPVGGSEEVGQ
jgi:assimilatory nitrate reductase catalytic subunit